MGKLKFWVNLVFFQLGVAVFVVGSIGATCVQ